MDKRFLIFGLITITALVVGHFILEVFIFGIVLSLGFVLLVEYIAPLKWIVYRSSGFLDIAFWVCSAVSIVALGVTIAGALGFASLAFTCVYRPYIQRKRAAINHKK